MGEPTITRNKIQWLQSMFIRGPTRKGRMVSFLCCCAVGRVSGHAIEQGLCWRPCCCLDGQEFDKWLHTVVQA